MLYLLTGYEPFDLASLSALALCTRYHQQDALDVVLIDLPHALFNFSEGEGESADYRDLESELVEAAGLLEEARVGGLVGGYGFATSR